MAYFEENDFPSAFFRDFGNDADHIIDRMNRILEDLEDQYGDPFKLIVEQLDEFRPLFIENIIEVVAQEVFDNNKRLDNVLSDIIDAVIMQAGKAIMDKNQNIGSDRTYDFIKKQFDENPYLGRGNDRGRGRGGDRGRGRNSGRGNDRGSDRGGRSGGRTSGGGRTGGSRRYDNDNRRENNDRTSGGGRTSGGRTGGSRMSGNKNSRRTNETETVQQNVQEEVVMDLTPGDVVTSQNLVKTNEAVAPIYLVGSEQVTFNGTTFEIEDYTGTSPVDYEKHRVDMLFTNIIGEVAVSSELEHTLNAIKRAEQAMDNTISRFVKNPENAEEVNVNSKLFATTDSMRYKDKITYENVNFDPIQIRDELIEEHGGTFEWFRNNAFIIDVEQRIDFEDSNDTLLIVQRLLKSPNNYLDVVQALIQLSGFLEPSRWRYLHDQITFKLNGVLARYANLSVHADSITGDWTALSGLLQSLDAGRRSIVVSRIAELTKGMDAARMQMGEKSLNVITHNRTLVYIPVASYELGLASASREIGVCSVAQDTAIYKLLAKLYSQDNVADATFVTLDGDTFDVISTEDITAREFTLLFHK